MRRALGLLLSGLGGALLLFVGGAYFHGAVARAEARAAWDRADARRVAQSADLARTTASEVFRPGASVALLRIPALGLDEVVVEGVGDTQLNAGPGHLPGSVLPGEAGNSIISAHRDRHFHGLDRLRVGDTLTTETGSRVIRWRIAERRVLDRHAPALFASSDARLTLTTCWPVRYTGSAPDRLILTALPITP